jgi:hypothetical protein
LASLAVSGLGSDFGWRGARSAAAPAALTSPRRSRKRSSERIPARPRPNVRARAQVGDVGNARRAAAMSGQKMQELARVALIGLDGLRREPALMRQRLQPGLARRLEVGFRRDEEFLHGCFPVSGSVSHAG